MCADREKVYGSYTSGQWSFSFGIRKHVTFIQFTKLYGKMNTVSLLVCITCLTPLYFLNFIVYTAVSRPVRALSWSCDANTASFVNVLTVRFGNPGLY